MPNKAQSPLSKAIAAKCNSGQVMASSNAMNSRNSPAPSSAARLDFDQKNFDLTLVENSNDKHLQNSGWNSADVCERIIRMGEDAAKDRLSQSKTERQSPPKTPGHLHLATEEESKRELSQDTAKPTILKIPL